MEEPLIVDTQMHGFERITAAFVVRGERTALVETGPKNRVDTVLEGLRSHAIGTVDFIIVTHIHLDHAGAAGTLARHFPEATVIVHQVGAPHLAEPSKLWASASRIYGENMERLWGGIEPIPPERIRGLADSDVVDLGGRTLRAIDTPGHAYHHHAYLDEATGNVFAGDALGVRLPDVGVVRPATPPPEFHLEKAIASIDKIASLEPARLFLTHFGPHDSGPGSLGVEATCERAKEGLARWGQWVSEARRRTADLEAVTSYVKDRASAETEGDLSWEQIRLVEQTTSYWMNTWGYMRYFDKQQRAPA